MIARQPYCLSVPPLSRASFTTPTTRRPGTLIIAQQPYCLSVPLLSRAIHCPHHKVSRDANNYMTVLLLLSSITVTCTVHYPHHKASADADE